MARLPIRRYQGEVCVVETPRDLARAQADLLEEDLVGFDTETRPAFTKGVHHLPCLVQVATARAVYLFPLRWQEVFPVLAGMLSASRIVKAGIGFADDLRSLKDVFPFEAVNMFDPGSIARRYGLEHSGLRNLAGIFLRFRIPKGKQTSNWAAAQLSPAQILYAATDAWACRELYLHYRASGMVK
ncbi:MAG: hypothetical protein A3H35_19345 [Betaproteobacteria bacterium RIFCSPLOWO2_02_FULL_62_17]|nr:MAG: hypothetical protein A3H35_19345 [Betaproteobacteria bacterium RIFCSPLOWO2_02_FULL_62_17]